MEDHCALSELPRGQADQKPGCRQLPRLLYVHDQGGLYQKANSLRLLRFTF